MTHQGVSHDAEGTERLLRLERMMTDAYDAALGKVDERRLVETLASFRAQHEKNVRVLQDVAQRAEGSRPQLDESFRRYLEEVLDTIADAIRRDESIGELRIAEAALRMEYGQVLSEVLDQQLAEQIKECMKSESENVSVLAMAHETSRT